MSGFVRRQNGPVYMDPFTGIEIIFHKIHSDLICGHMDLVCPFQQNLDAEMAQVQPQPSVCVIAVADEVEGIYFQHLIPVLRVAICIDFLTHMCIFQTLKFQK